MPGKGVTVGYCEKKNGRKGLLLEECAEGWDDEVGMDR